MNENQIRLSYHVNTAGTLIEMSMILKDGETSSHGPAIKGESQSDGSHLSDLNGDNIIALIEILKQRYYLLEEEKWRKKHGR